MAGKINTTSSVNKPNVTDADLQKQIVALGSAFKAEKQVKVNIPKGLAKNVGPTLFVGINGVNLVIPVDGEDHSVPETFASHVKEYLKNLTT